MSVSKAIASLFDVRPGEGRLVALLVAEAFCIGLARLFTQTVQGTLFVVTFGAQSWPYVYMAVALVVPALGLAYTRLESRLALPHLLMGNLACLLLGLAAISGLLALSHARWPVFALAVWYEAIWAMTSLALWGLAGRLLDVRQGKRLFPLIAAGDVVAAVLGGLLTPVLVRRLGIGGLLGGALAGMAGALLLVAYITHLFAGALGGSAGEEQDRRYDASAGARQRRYITLIIALAALSFASYYFIDLIFYRTAEEQFPDETRLASFLGVYWAAVNLAMLLSNLFVVSRVINRYGVRAGLLALPVATAIVAALLALSGTFRALPMFLFALAALNNLFDWVFRETMYRSSLLTLFQPLPAALRLRFQAFTEGVAQPLAQGMAGVALFGLGLLGFGVSRLSLVLFGMLGACIVLALPLGRMYASMVLQALTKRTLGGTARPALGGHAVSAVATVSGSESTAVLLQALADPHPGVVLYALGLLEEMEHPALAGGLERLLAHPVPDIRCEALSRIERLGLHTVAPAVRRRVETEADPAVRGSVLRTLATLDANESIPKLAPYLDHAEPAVRQGALVGLLRSGDLAGILLAGERLYRLIDAPDPDGRALAAAVLGDVGVATYDQPVLKLLDDPDPRVRKAALVAAGKLKSSRLWAPVIAALDIVDLRAEAADALVAGGSAAVSALQATLARPDLTSATRLRLIRVAGRLPRASAILLLKEQVAVPDAELRYHTLLALTRHGYRATDAEGDGIKQLLTQEGAAIARALAALVDIGDLEGASLLKAALQQAIDGGRERLFLLLACLYDPHTVTRVRDTLAHPLPEKRAYAFEALDMLIARELKASVFPLLEDLTPEERLQRLAPVFAPPRLDPQARLQQIVAGADELYGPWIRACARYATHASSGTLQEGAGMLLVIEKVIILKTVSIFAGTPDSTLAEVAALLEEQVLSAGERLFEKGDPGRCMYIVVSGRVRVHDGDQILNDLGERDIVGEMAVLESAPRSASVTAVEETRLLRLDQEPLYELMADHVDVARGIIQVLSSRLRARIEDIGDLRAQLHREEEQHNLGLARSS